jgi:hypothetical protein
MKIKLTTLMKTKFNIPNPHEVVKGLKQVGKISATSLRKPFEDTPLENFDMEVVKKYIKYVEACKNKTTLVYDPNYWMYRCNLTLEEATSKVADAKRDKSTSKDNFIKRHGREKGEKLFLKFQKTSAYSSSDDWFRDKYGDDWQKQKEKHRKKASKRCLNYWTSQGYSEEAAKVKVSEYQQTTSGVHKQYYREKGYAEDEIEVIIHEINKKKRNHRRNTEYLKEKYPDDWREKYKEASNRYRSRMEELGIWIEISIIDDFKKYKTLVNRYTDESTLFYGDLLPNLKSRSKDFHLDHKYSMKMGFINDIPPEVIGSVVNLEILPAKLNSSKRAKCSITKQDLLNKYAEFKQNHED